MGTAGTKRRDTRAGVQHIRTHLAAPFSTAACENYRGIGGATALFVYTSVGKLYGGESEETATLFSHAAHTES